jgi:hypothetical protein
MLPGREAQMQKNLRGETDKPLGYLLEYEKALQPLLGRDVSVLELGVAFGGSLLMWRDFFSGGPVIGVDLQSIELKDPSGRIRTYVGKQQDTALLTTIAEAHAPNGFDLIVDDASHVGEITKTSFWHLFERHLKPGGIYAIEDWGTGYWLGHPFYPDGRHADPDLAARASVPGEPFPSHHHGMPGFVKQLVDEVAMNDITHAEHGVPPQRPSRISRMEISPGLVLVFKV